MRSSLAHCTRIVSSDPRTTNQCPLATEFNSFGPASYHSNFSFTLYIHGNRLYPIRADVILSSKIIVEKKLPLIS